MKTPGWDHSRLFLWPIGANTWIVRTKFPITRCESLSPLPPLPPQVGETETPEIGSVEFSRGSARVRESVDRSLPKFAIPGQRVAFLKLLRCRGVYDTRYGGLSLASFRSVSKISMPTTTPGSPRVETHQYLENGMERMLRSKQETSEMKELFGDNSLPWTKLWRRNLQLVRALLKRNMVNMIEADEVRERVGVFLVDLSGKDSQRLIIDAMVSNFHFLKQLGDVRRSEPC